MTKTRKPYNSYTREFKLEAVRCIRCWVPFCNSSGKGSSICAGV